MFQETKELTLPEKTTEIEPWNIRMARDIRVGCLIAPEKAQCSLYSDKEACVLGAAGLGAGIFKVGEFLISSVSLEKGYDDLVKYYGLSEKELETIWGLNDGTELSREEIANLIEKGEI